MGAAKNGAGCGLCPSSELFENDQIKADHARKTNDIF
jgi:hypothetical protein